MVHKLASNNCQKDPGSRNDTAEGQNKEQKRKIKSNK